jgi:hypothetical protein
VYTSFFSKIAKFRVLTPLSASQNSNIFENARYLTMSIKSENITLCDIIAQIIFYYGPPFCVYKFFLKNSRIPFTREFMVLGDFPARVRDMHVAGENSA